MRAMTAIAALLSLLILFGCPALGLPAIVLTANLYVWRRRAEIIRAERARARAKASSRRRREFMAAARSLR